MAEVDLNTAPALESRAPQVRPRRIVAAARHSDWNYLFFRIPLKASTGIVHFANGVPSRPEAEQRPSISWFSYFVAVADRRHFNPLAAYPTGSRLHRRIEPGARPDTDRAGNSAPLAQKFYSFHPIRPSGVVHSFRR